MNKMDKENMKIIWAALCMGFMLLLTTLWLVGEAQKGWKEALDNWWFASRKLYECENELNLLNQTQMDKIKREFILVPQNKTVECLTKYNATICCQPGEAIKSFGNAVVCYNPQVYSNVTVKS